MYDPAKVAEIEARHAASSLFEEKKAPPAVKIGEINLEEELVAQYHRVIDLQNEVIGDQKVPANQKAQVAGQVAATLSQLIKLQEDLQRSEAFKLMESVLAEAIKTLPAETKAAFFAEYERLAAQKGLL